MPVLSLSRRQDERVLDCERSAYENPWKEIEWTVRKVDEEKIKDCTEDIDTLLVFAGLYSAVLTAFLIESYKNLFADESESLLRQMVHQTANYQFTNGYLSTTFNTSQLPTFKAAVSDIRVNVCWFASLILSLSSASFGIAVKQWLREFLAIDCISPQERLRIRDARLQGLADWKLFQIAAFLPILLQISLLLFFVGLCFFTAAVHRSIGITSLFLVSCWAFLFLTSIIAPLFSLRCPYKTTLLKIPFRYARPRIRLFSKFLYAQLTVLLAHSRRKTPINKRDEATLTSPEHMKGSWDALYYYGDYMDLGILGSILWHAAEKDTAPEEEDKIRNVAEKDLIILRNIDIAFFDDRLLASMPGALSQGPATLDDGLQLVMTIVQGRIGSSLSETPAENTRKREPWPWTLSRQARVALIDMLVESMVHDLRHVYWKWWQWKHHEVAGSEWTASFVLLVLLAYPHEAAPRSVARLFNELILLEYNRGGPFDVFFYQMRTLARTDPDWPARSLLFLAQSLETLNAEKSEVKLRRTVMKGFVDREYDQWFEDPETYRRLLERNPDDCDGDVVAPTPQRIVALLEVARVILHKYILEQTQGQDKLPEGIDLLLKFVLDATARVIGILDVDFRKPLTGAPDGPGLRQVLMDLFVTPHTTRSLLYFFGTHAHLLCPSGDRPTFMDLIRRGTYPSRDDGIRILAAWSEFFTSQATSGSKTSYIVDSSATLLHVCRLVYSCNTYDDEETVAAWQRLFGAVHACYKHIIRHQSHCDTNAAACRYSNSGEQHTDTCEAAYRILYDCDYGQAQFKVSNELANFLRSFVCASHTLNQYGDKFFLLQRLEAAEAAAVEATTSKQPPNNFVEKLETDTNEAMPSGSGLGDGALVLVVSTRANSIDGRLYAEQLTSPSEDSASRGPVVTDDALIGGTTSLSPHGRAQHATLNDSGIHDTGEWASPSSRLEKRAEAAASEKTQSHAGYERKTMSSEAGSSRSPAASSTFASTAIKSPDDQIDVEQHAKAGKSSMLSGLAKADDDGPGDVALSQALQEPNQGPADTGNGGHDGSHGAESSQAVDLARNADMALQYRASVEAIQVDIFRSRSVRLFAEAQMFEPSESTTTIPGTVLPVNVPDNTQAEDPYVSSSNALLRDSDTDTYAPSYEQMHPPTLRPPTFLALLDDDDVLAGNTASRYEGCDVAASHDSCATIPSGHDVANSFPDIVLVLKDDGGHAAGPRREGSDSEQLAASESPRISPPCAAHICGPLGTALDTERGSRGTSSIRR